MLVWKLTANFASGDLIAYADEGKGHVSPGRITKPSQEAVFVKRNDSEPTTVLHSAVVGKVISVLWRGTAAPVAQASVAQPTIARGRIGPPSLYMISASTTGHGKPSAVGAFADIFVDIHDADPTHPEVRPLVRRAKVAALQRRFWFSVISKICFCPGIAGFNVRPGKKLDEFDSPAKLKPGTTGLLQAPARG